MDPQLENAKIMLDEEEEAELFPEGESLLHGGGTKAVTYRDWTFATMFLTNMAVILVLFIVFLFAGKTSTQSQHRMLGRDVSLALYLSGVISLGFAFLWLCVLKVSPQRCVSPPRDPTKSHSLLLRSLKLPLLSPGRSPDLNQGRYPLLPGRHLLCGCLQLCERRNSRRRGALGAIGDRGSLRKVCLVSC